MKIYTIMMNIALWVTQGRGHTTLPLPKAFGLEVKEALGIRSENELQQIVSEWEKLAGPDGQEEGAREAFEAKWRPVVCGPSHLIAANRALAEEAATRNNQLVELAGRVESLTKKLEYSQTEVTQLRTKLGVSERTKHDTRIFAAQMRRGLAQAKNELDIAQKKLIERDTEVALLKVDLETMSKEKAKQRGSLKYAAQEFSDLHDRAEGWRKSVVALDEELIRARGDLEKQKEQVALLEKNIKFSAKEYKSLSEENDHLKNMVDAAGNWMAHIKVRKTDKGYEVFSLVGPRPDWVNAFEGVRLGLSHLKGVDLSVLKGEAADTAAPVTADAQAEEAIHLVVECDPFGVSNESPPDHFVVDDEGQQLFTLGKAHQVADLRAKEVAHEYKTVKVARVLSEVGYSLTRR